VLVQTTGDGPRPEARGRSAIGEAAGAGRDAGGRGPRGRPPAWAATQEARPAKGGGARP
jgi:hypothetical protein